jgi:hypothetical protein
MGLMNGSMRMPSGKNYNKIGNGKMTPDAFLREE